MMYDYPKSPTHDVEGFPTEYGFFVKGYNVEEPIFIGETRTGYTCLDWDSYLNTFQISVYGMYSNNKIVHHYINTFAEAKETYKQIRAACLHAIDNKYLTV